MILYKFRSCCCKTPIPPVVNMFNDNSVSFSGPDDIPDGLLTGEMSQFFTLVGNVNGAAYQSSAINDASSGVYRYPVATYTTDFEGGFIEPGYSVVSQGGLSYLGQNLYINSLVQVEQPATYSLTAKFTYDNLTITTPAGVNVVAVYLAIARYNVGSTGVNDVLYGAFTPLVSNGPTVVFTTVHTDSAFHHVGVELVVQLSAPTDQQPIISISNGSVFFRALE